MANFERTAPGNIQDNDLPNFVDHPTAQPGFTRAQRRAQMIAASDKDPVGLHKKWRKKKEIRNRIVAKYGKGTLAGPRRGFNLGSTAPVPIW